MPSLDVRVSLRLVDGAYLEVVRPSAQRAVQLLHHAAIKPKAGHV
jgi:hypothetical protein